MSATSIRDSFATILLDAQNRVQNATVAAKNFMLPLRLRSDTSGDTSNNNENNSRRARQAYNCGVNWVSCQPSWPGQSESKSKSQTPLPAVAIAHCCRFLLAGCLVVQMFGCCLFDWQLIVTACSVSALLKIVFCLAASTALFSPLFRSLNFITIWQYAER